MEKTLKKVKGCARVHNIKNENIMRELDVHSVQNKTDAMQTKLHKPHG
jgi:hypothetical protein